MSPFLAGTVIREVRMPSNREIVVGGGLVAVADRTARKQNAPSSVNAISVAPIPLLALAPILVGSLH